VALATQGVLSNVAAGLTIIFTKPFRVGQYVQIVGVEGRWKTSRCSAPAEPTPTVHLIVDTKSQSGGEILQTTAASGNLDVAVGVPRTDLSSALPPSGDPAQ